MAVRKYVLSFDGFLGVMTRRRRNKWLARSYAPLPRNNKCVQERSDIYSAILSKNTLVFAVIIKKVPTPDFARKLGGKGYPSFILSCRPPKRGGARMFESNFGEIRKIKARAVGGFRVSLWIFLSDFCIPDRTTLSLEGAIFRVKSHLKLKSIRASSV